MNIKAKQIYKSYKQTAHRLISSIDSLLHVYLSLIRNSICISKANRLFQKLINMSAQIVVNDVEECISDKNSISFIDFNQPFQWTNPVDGFLLKYQTRLNSLTEPQDNPNQTAYFLYNRSEQFQTPHLPQIQLFRFKDIFFDLLQGQNHQLTYLGHSSSNATIQTEILKNIVSILFKIAQQQKIVYPHLITHIKEQFYKPNIFDQQFINSNTNNHSILIDIFFNQAQQTSKYHDFIKLNPFFQDICLTVFRKIATENHKRTQSQDQHQSNSFKTKSFQIIQNLCSKFLIQINHFGYDEPQIQMFALANEERFVFLCESDHLFLLTLQKFQFLNVRRKSSHNISVNQKNQKSLKKSSQNKSLKKNSWSQLDESAHFKSGQTVKNYLVLNIIDSDETSNYESSILKSQSKVNELSDQSTPKFKHSSIAHLRKKSHKDSFGGVDFDNMVYKDLANPKRYADQKAHRQKDNAKNNPLNKQIYNKKVLSERFEMNELQSLTYADDQESSIEFVPHFQMNEANQKGKTVSVFGNNPTSPAYSNNTYNSFTNYVAKFEMEENKSKMILRMKGSNIEKNSQYFANQEDQLPQMVPQFKHQNSLQSQGRAPRAHSPGSRVLASSQIIEFTGSFFKQQSFKSDQHQKEESHDFLIIPSINSKFNNISQKDESGNNFLFASPQKDVFMSFSKNDKQKFIILDTHEQVQPILQKSSQKIQRVIKETLESDQREKEDSINNVRTRKYSYRTQRQQRQKFRNQIKVQQQAEVFKATNSFISEHTPSLFTKKSKYKKYHEANTSESVIFNQYDSTSQINMNNSHTFTNPKNQREVFKLERKHSSNIPVYKAIEPQQTANRSRYPEVNFNTKNVQKRFQQNSVRFSQVFQNNENQIFYIQQKDESRQSFGNRKQRKVTDFYERPLTNLARGGNRASQIIENGATTNINQNTQNRFESHLQVSNDHNNILINSGGGKNYSVISNISYDEERRIEDLLEVQNKQGLTRRPTMLENNEYRNLTDQQIDFGNIQAIERLLMKKKQQKLKLSSQQSFISINSKSNNNHEPLDWVKKEVFYFFEQSPFSPLRPPEKHVIVNPERTVNKVHKQNSVKSRQKYRDLPSSSTSLHNYCSLMRDQNPEFEGDREKSVSKKSLGERKYSVKDMKPISEVNLNSLLEIAPIHKLNSSPPCTGNKSQNVIQIRQNRSGAHREYDMMSVHTQPSAVSLIRLSPPKRQLIPVPTTGQQSLNIPIQNLKTYPSQPVIRFTLGINPQPFPPPTQTHSYHTTLRPVPSQLTINSYRIN